MLLVNVYKDQLVSYKCTPHTNYVAYRVLGETVPSEGSLDSWKRCQMCVRGERC